MSSVVTPKVLQVLAQVEESVGNVLEAKTMPKEVYADPEFFAFELEAVHARSWLCLGRVDQVSEPGDYVRVDIEREPLLVVMDADRTVRVLSAVCPHRGCVVAEGGGNFGKSIRCPLHHWTFAFDGTLLGAPGMGPTASTEELRAEGHNLYELPVEVWNGFLFTNMQPDPPPPCDPRCRSSKPSSRTTTCRTW